MLLFPEIDVQNAGRLHVAYSNNTEIASDFSAEVAFARKFIKSGGNFIFSKSYKELVYNLHSICLFKRWNHVYSLDKNLTEIFLKYGFKRSLLDISIGQSSSAAMVSESLIAENGTIMLSPRQAACRLSPMFPKAQIIIAGLNQIRETVLDAVDHFNLSNHNELPCMLNLHSNSPSQYRVEDTIILDAKGTKEVYLFLVDEDLRKY